LNDIWLTADEHYNHDNIIKFCGRPFADVKEMKEAFIENHNKVVKPGDRVYHLGDMFWRTTTVTEAIEIVTRLNGQHYYIYGNHDEVFRKNPPVRNMFIWCRDAENLKVDGYPHIWLSHYAHRVWNGSHRGAYHLYGHTHNALPQDGSLSFDVGVDAQKFAPISLEEVHVRMKKILEANGDGKFSCLCGNSFTDRYRANAICAKCGKVMERV
jgi:calcineurin-like phosphoesterase family protein